MRELVDSFWRAAAYCLHPRVIWLSLLPLVLCGLLAGVLGYFYWDAAIGGVRAWLEGWPWTATALAWLDGVGGGALRASIAPLLVVVLAVPPLVIFSLLVVALLMMPRMVDLVAQRRFAALERRHGEPFWRSVLWSAGATLAAIVMLVVSMPLWLIPPLVLLLPPLIWGWLSYRVMTFDALAEHATREERQAIMREHRLPLLGIGVMTGYLGAAPALVWAVSAALLVLAPVLVVVSIWLYTLVFAFSALWFTHYCLAALETLRASRPANPMVPSPGGLVPPAAPVRPAPESAQRDAPTVLPPI